MLIVFSVFSVKADTIKTIGPQYEHDASHSYFMHILHRAIAVTASEYGAKSTIEYGPRFNLSQNRSFMLLEKGSYYDVLWSANSAARNTKLEPIPFPLFKGLLGKRGFVVLAEHKAKIENMQSIQELKNLNICQGRDWPDANILQDNGFNITEVTFFEPMLNMVKLKRCDAVTLSIIEGPAETAALTSKNNELVFVDSKVISYQLVMNFYVQKNKSKLKSRLTEGLLILEESGEFERIMRTHPLTRNVIKHLDLSSKQIFELPIQHQHLHEQSRFFIQ